MCQVPTPIVNQQELMQEKNRAMLKQMQDEMEKIKMNIQKKEMEIKKNSEMPSKVKCELNTTEQRLVGL